MQYEKQSGIITTVLRETTAMKFLVPTFIIIVLIIFGVFIFGINKKSTPKPVSVAQSALQDYASTTAEVRLTIDGRVVGDDTHRAIRITIGRNQRKVEVIQGYQGNIINSKTQDGNESAYDVFLRSLNSAGFTKERKSKVVDERGVCSSGNRYIYELINTENSDMRRWSTSCGAGTFGGQSQAIRTLFQNQITEYETITSAVEL